MDRDIREDLKKAKSKQLKPFPSDTQVETLEFFDNHGILLSKTPVDSFQTTRYSDQPSTFLACYINGELGLFVENDKTILSRIENIKEIINNGGL